ncbi:MAG: hypothetical protein IJ515_06755 [Clostridia bacterium]|nr:hypothetical protein [Clostridia bacterium]
MNRIIKNDFYTVTVSDIGAEIISVQGKCGGEFMWQSPSEKFWSKHSPLLFPVCGRLKNSEYTYGGKRYDMSAHGYISKKSFSLIELSESKITLSSSSDEETKMVYPFDYDFTVTYSLDGDVLRCEYTVSNRSGEPMPYMFGLHPGFALSTDGGADIEDYSLLIGKDTVQWIPLQNAVFARPYSEDFTTPSGIYRINEAEIYKNDTMIFTEVPPRVKLFSDKNAYSVDMRWSDNLPYLCIWKEPDSSAKFICLEPWTGTPADGVTDENFETRRMCRLAPGSSQLFFCELKFNC